MCDLIINVCDSLCCCDTRCQDTLITEWTEAGKCSNLISKYDYMYPQCGKYVNNLNTFHGQYHINQINDIMCSAVERLPYSGVFANLADTTTETTTLVGFDLTQNLLFTLITNPQTIDITKPQYSGNPGYIKGKPLMIGKTNGDGFNLIWLQSLRVYAWDKDGYCSNSSSYNANAFKIINFGEDTVIQCTLPNTTTMSSYCTSSTKYEIWNAFNDTANYYVGKWGSSNNNKTGEWIRFNSTQMSISSTCKLPIIQQLTILYQKVGFVGDLQNTIIQANITDIPFDYSKFQNNQVQLTLRVQFIELIASELNQDAAKSFYDTITPYVKKIFEPFSYSIILGTLLILYI